MVISYLGVQTDRHDFGILIWKHVGTQKISTREKSVILKTLVFTAPHLLGIIRKLVLSIGLELCVGLLVEGCLNLPSAKSFSVNAYENKNTVLAVQRGNAFSSLSR